MGVRRQMAGTFEQLERKIRRVNAEGEALTNEAVKIFLVIERVRDRRNSTGAVAEQV